MAEQITRKFSLLDHVLSEANHALEIVFSTPRAARQNPAGKTTDSAKFSDTDKQQSAAFMRINHTGEICAQALYRGQAFVSRDAETRSYLHQAAIEENDHLAWCQTRLDELDSHPSYLNPLWYGASFKIGALAGLMGDAFSLGFVVETENQVEAHLDSHLADLPSGDKRSRKILAQMKTDEAGHANQAKARGGADLPKPVQCMMKLQSQVMTHTAYYI
jgi:ubiquinone biosynthesis monooxygenase Coq7